MILLLSQPTLRRDDEGKIDKPKRSSPREKMSEVATNIYSRKTLEKSKRGLRILKRRIRELFTPGEGISAPSAHHKRQQPLIECAQRDFNVLHFSFLYSFLGRQRCCPCSYVSSSALRNSNLCSSLRTERWLNCFFLSFLKD